MPGPSSEPPLPPARSATVPRRRGPRPARRSRRRRRPGSGRAAAGAGSAAASRAPTGHARPWPPGPHSFLESLPFMAISALLCLHVLLGGRDLAAAVHRGPHVPDRRRLVHPGGSRGQRKYQRIHLKQQGEGDWHRDLTHHQRVDGRLTQPAGGLDACPAVQHVVDDTGHEPGRHQHVHQVTGRYRLHVGRVARHAEPGAIAPATGGAPDRCGGIAAHRLHLPAASAGKRARIGRRVGPASVNRTRHDEVTAMPVPGTRLGH